MRIRTKPALSSGFPFCSALETRKRPVVQAPLANTQVLANLRRSRRNGARRSARGCPRGGRSGAGRSAQVAAGTGRSESERRGWRRRGGRRRRGGSHSPPVRAIFRGAWPSSLKDPIVPYVYCSRPSPTTSDVALESPPHCHSFEQLASWKEVFGWLSATLLMLDLMLVIFCSCLMTRQQLIPATLSLLYGSYYPRVPMWRKSSGKRRV